MRIVYISSSTVPSRTANSIHVMKMCQAFAKSGHEVALIVRDNGNEMQQGVTDAHEYYGVDTCFDIIKLPWMRMKGRGYVYGLSAARKAGTMSPDLVYCRNTAGCFFVAKTGLPVIFEAHSPPECSGRIQERMFRSFIGLHNLRKLVVITSALKEHCQARYPHTKGRIQVAPDGADAVPPGIQPVELPGKGTRVQAGYVGHLYKGKAMELIAKLAPACTWADFHVVGGMDDDIRYWQNKCREVRNIRFHGHVPHQEVSRYIAAFDVVLLPLGKVVAPCGSGSNDIASWTSPLKVFEYMAAGKPIVSSDLPVLRDVLRHDHNALLCPFDDVDAWLSALQVVRKDRELRERLGKTACREFMEHYTWEKRAQRVLAPI